MPIGWTDRLSAAPAAPPLVRVHLRATPPVECTIRVGGAEKVDDPELLRLVKDQVQQPLHLRMLVVEDDEFCRQAYEILLTQANSTNRDLTIDFRFATNVHEALTLLQGVDIILLDVNLNGDVEEGDKNGDAMLPVIRRHLGDSVVLIVVSGYSQVALVQRCLLLGADMFMEKPISTATLRSVWMLWLAKNRHRVHPADIPQSPFASPQTTDATFEEMDRLVPRAAAAGKGPPPRVERSSLRDAAIEEQAAWWREYGEADALSRASGFERRSRAAGNPEEADVAANCKTQ